MLTFLRSIPAFLKKIKIQLEHKLHSKSEDELNISVINIAIQFLVMICKMTIKSINNRV